MSRSINKMTFADGSCEGRSRSEEDVMQGHRRRRATQRSPATPISPKGDGGTASISLSLLLRDAHDIASSLLRELDAVALATNVMVFLGRDTSYNGTGSKPTNTFCDLIRELRPVLRKSKTQSDFLPRDFRTFQKTPWKPFLTN